MPETNENIDQPPSGSVVRRISGVVALIVMVVSSFRYIPDDDPGGGEILTGLFIGTCTGSTVLVLGWVVEYALGRNSKHAQKQHPQAAISRRTSSSLNSDSEARKSSTDSSNDLTAWEQDELNLLIERVPFTSLTRIVSLLVCCIVISLAGFTVLVTTTVSQPEFRNAVSASVIVGGIGAFCCWSLLPRRTRYLNQFKEMLNRQPILTWSYTDAEWNGWLELVRDLNYPRMVPRKIVRGGIVLGVPVGFYRAVTHEPGASPFVAFLWGYAFSMVVCSLVAFLFYRYWVILCRDWQHGPTETRIFEDGIFFHHRFVDWKDCPDKAVLVEVVAESTPVATLIVTTAGTGSGLAPQINFMAPVPQGQLDVATELARDLSQNVNLEDDEQESTNTD